MKKKPSSRKLSAVVVSPAPAPDPIPILHKPIFLLAFIGNYWRMLFLFIALVIVGRIDAVTYFTGPIFYLIEMVVGCQVAAALAKHIFYRQSVDTYTQTNTKDADGLDSGTTQFVEEWVALDARTRVILTVALMIALFLGAAWIASNLAK